MFIDFFKGIKKKNAEIRMKGYVILESTRNARESIVLTFWATEEDMQKFYSPDNTILAGLVESAKPLFEKMPERTDYFVPELFVPT